MKLLTLLAGFLLVAGCDSTLESLRQQEKWKSQEIHDYRFVYTVSCFCGFTGPNPALITVQGDKVAKVEYVAPSPNGEYPTAGYPTIDSLFARISRANVRGAATVDVDYDEAYAFPKTIYIDQSKNVIDEEVQYKVENFTTLSPAAITYPADKEKE